MMVGTVEPVVDETVGVRLRGHQLKGRFEFLGLLILLLDCISTCLVTQNQMVVVREIAKSVQGTADISL